MATFNHHTDVLELVCEAVGCETTSFGFGADAVADLMALRRCSHAWADAVSGAMRRGCRPYTAEPNVPVK